MANHTWRLERYSVSIAVSAFAVTSVADFRAISFETTRMGQRRFTGTLWFWSGPPAQGNLPTADQIGTFRRDHLHAFLAPELFDGTYALMRSEWPVVLRFSEDEGRVWLLELGAADEPVGEVVDRTVRLPDAIRRGEELIADLGAAFD